MFSFIFNIAANLYQLTGLIFWEWEWQQVVLVYWIETWLCFGLTFYRMVFTKSPAPKQSTKRYLEFYGIFFGLQTFALFFSGYVLNKEDPLFPLGLIMVAALHSIPMIASHVYSLYENFYLGGERNRTIGYFFWPMKRVWINQLTVIGAPFLFTYLGSGSVYAIILIATKTLIDLILHITFHPSRTNTNASKSGAV